MPQPPGGRRDALHGTPRLHPPRVLHLASRGFTKSRLTSALGARMAALLPRLPGGGLPQLSSAGELTLTRTRTRTLTVACRSSRGQASSLNGEWPLMTFLIASDELRLLPSLGELAEWGTGDAQPAADEGRGAMVHALEGGVGGGAWWAWEATPPWEMR